MHIRLSLLTIALVSMLVAAACGSESTNVQQDAGPPDETPPVVVLGDYLPRYDVVVGLRSVEMLATDDVAVARAELLVDGAVVAESTQEPFTMDWDTSTAADGVRSVQVAAYDAAENRGESDVVPVFVVNTGEVVQFDETPDLGTAFVQTDFEVPANWTTQDIDLKWHWTMPAGITRTLAVMIFDASVGFEFNYSVGTGWCPHSGVKQAELTESDGEILVDHDADAALAEGQWFVHVGSTNAADLKGQTASFKVRVVLLP